MTGPAKPSVRSVSHGPQPGQRGPDDDDVLEAALRHRGNDAIRFGRARDDARPADARRRERDAPGVVPGQRQRVRRDRRRLRRWPGVRRHGGRHAAGRVHLRADAVRPGRRRAVVPRVRRHRADRADGADVGAVDPLPAPGDRRGAVGPGHGRGGRPAQRRRHASASGSTTAPHKPTAVAQGTYVLPAPDPSAACGASPQQALGRQEALGSELATDMLRKSISPPASRLKPTTASV